LLWGAFRRIPVSYHFVDHAIHFRTGEGTKLAATTRNSVVAFQVDDIDRFYHARWSVLAVGPAEELKESADLNWPRQLPCERGHRGCESTLFASCLSTSRGGESFLAMTNPRPGRNFALASLADSTSSG